MLTSGVDGNVAVGFQPAGTCMNTDPVITGPTTVCFGSTGNIYTATPTGMANYHWLVSGGNITAGGGLTDNTVTVDWIIPVELTQSLFTMTTLAVHLPCMS